MNGMPPRRIAGLLFGSGAAALVYQTVWLRELRLVFGASTAASAAVLAVFMGGLGLGGLLLGPRAARHPRPLAFYAHLELGVARERPVRPAIELEVEGAPREVLVELDVLTLALLPARGDRGDGAIGNAERGKDVFQERRLVLGSEKPDGSSRLRLSLHSALTFTDSPTRFSMRRSSSSRFLRSAAKERRRLAPWT